MSTGAEKIHQVDISHVRTKYKFEEISDCVNELRNKMNGLVVPYAVAAALTITYF